MATLKQLKEGTIQRKLKDSASKEQQQFDAGEEVLLGTNKHPNEKDKNNPFADVLGSICDAILYQG